MASIEADLEDLTARARIREAALRQFGELGFERATIRGIAETAGVSSGLVRHHFGSKEALREACDEFLVKTLRRVRDATFDDPMLTRANPVAMAQAAFGPYQPYLVRALVEGRAEPLFDEMVRAGEQWLAEADAERADPPFADRKARATVSTAMALAVTILHRHVSRSLGVDVASPEGAHLLATVILDLHSHPALSPETAAEMRAALERIRPA
ncbi:TetR/AcrR family transcriptional regulator [Nonomuraea roseoviolacea]|uniref:AcrR family transcriptional regulator n=1 Tax=Nonomuraea roseoviolacea subsp. carminata TaxID=160689 RepID=A0ABT1K0J3_9ACTN|nr:TetR/AcrR family transcriptional regulator [Nonomuraea roseoviolacea]MCP2347519.1 AcrR family transcriptional regulator [Nonomuraea roseoviolacea subsp. carminata]